MCQAKFLCRGTNLSVPVNRVVNGKYKVQHRLVRAGVVVEIGLYNDPRAICKGVLHVWYVLQYAPELLCNL